MIEKDISVDNPPEPISAKGFSLIEVAIVLVILSLLLSSLILPLNAQREANKIREAERQLDNITEALLGFASANGRLPCPAVPATQDGLESGGGGANCTSSHGFVPGNTLGLAGAYNGDILLLDPWHNPIRYSVTTSDNDGDGLWDFIRDNEIADVGMGALTPDLSICDGVAAAASCGGANPVSQNIPAVILSMGKDWPDYTSAVQQENTGTTLGGYDIANDRFFVSKDRSRLAGQEFDDITTWLSPSILYSKMVSAGQL